MRICTKTGQRLPMYCTAGGKAILAYLPAEELNATVAGFRYESYTANTVSSEDDLRQQLEHIRQTGYAIEREELEYGLICVSVPVLNHMGYPVAAVSCSGPTARMTEEKIQQCQIALLSCSKRLSAIIPES